MKTIVALLIFASAIFLACNGSSFMLHDNNYKSSDKEYSFIKEYSISSPANVVVSTTGGDIKAMSSGNEKVEVIFIVKKNNKVLDVSLEQLKDIAEVEITSESSKLEINVKKIYERHVNVGFIVKTPSQTSCNFTTSGGDIQLTGLKGDQNIETSGGDLVFKNLSGNVKANTSGGNIKINNAVAVIDVSTSGGDIVLDSIEGVTKVSTSGGSIKAKNLKPSLQAHTSGGDIKLQNLQGIIDASTSGGNVSLLNIDGSIKATTSGGDIEAVIIKLTDQLILETSGGSVQAAIPSGLGLSLDLSGEEVDTHLSNFSGTAKKDKIQGAMNGGGILVQLSTSGGSVKLDFK